MLSRQVSSGTPTNHTGIGKQIIPFSSSQLLLFLALHVLLTFFYLAVFLWLNRSDIRNSALEEAFGERQTECFSSTQL
jgi:hypothetical protein